MGLNTQETIANNTSWSAFISQFLIMKKLYDTMIKLYEAVVNYEAVIGISGP